MQLIVLGMHRSGTSSVTRLLNMMGAYVGEETDLIGANPENPKGFWERQDVIACNDAILAAHGCCWHDLSSWPPMPAALPDPDTIEEQQQRIVSALNTHKDWAMKDPRLCHTLPHWLPQLDKPVLVIVYRHPVAIARSLFKRNRLPLEMGLAIWEASMIELLRYRELHPCIEISYEQLMQDPVHETNKLFQKLGELGDHQLKPATEPDITAFIDPSLNRSSSASEADPLSIFQRLVYHAIEDRQLHEREFSLSREAKLLMKASRSVMAMSERMDALEDEVKRALGTIHEHEDRLDETLADEDAFTRLKQSHSELQTAHADTIKQLEQAIIEREIAEKEIEALKTSRWWRLRKLFNLPL